MFRHLLTSSAIAIALAFGTPAGIASGEAGQNPIKKVGKATKEAGKDVAKETKEVGKKTGEVTKDAAQKTAKGTKNVGKRVEGGVTPGVGSHKCTDGTVQTGKTAAEACVGHGRAK